MPECSLHRASPVVFPCVRPRRARPPRPGRPFPGPGPASERMLKKLFVGSLPFDATADELREMFAPFGRVMSATIATDRETGQPRGFGFVVMVEGGEEAIQALHQAKFGNRTLTVSEAKPRESRPPGGYARAR